jgi:uncharacterized damage-inducible protein DinB
MLETLFRYNWMVREEWFELCKQISIEELLRTLHLSIFSAHWHTREQKAALL